MVLNACDTTTQIIIETDLGDIVCEIYDKKAPVTSQNFLTYTDENRFEGAEFYRVVTRSNQPDNDIKIEVIQGGLFKDDHPLMMQPIIHETTKQTGVRHKKGALSMARLEPGTATSEFFICITNQPELDYGGKRNPDGQGFAAFGVVVKGMEIVEQIHALKNTNQMLDQRVKINKIRRF
jgi:peptidyl-prolyl cis-trans isomerase A (cyclophilin A)